jgi:drug/metabolite transporter (DMT)-like permease
VTPGNAGIGPALALGAALLFGLSAPAAKSLVAAADPWLVAAVLYLGSGIGLTTYRAIRSGRHVEPRLARAEWRWLAAAIVAGGIVGPVLLLFGLALGSAAQGALLLNLEGVFTALLAWCVFREAFAARIAVGMLAITSGALVLVVDPSAALGLDWSALLVAGACIAWAVDNNLTRRIASADPVQIAATKGLVAGVVNLVIALARGASLPGPTVLTATALVGLLGYGTSLVLFVRALRHLGTARTAAYFSTAPFIGALGAILALGEPVTSAVFAAAMLMALGVWLHLSEHHEHSHEHEAFEHDHVHWHDEHHWHDHSPGDPVREPHTHVHAHAPLRHTHPHYPDLHHRHPH